MNRSNAANIYDSLFNGKTRPLSNDLQAEFDKETQKAQAKVAAMTEEEKAAEFNRIMGRQLTEVIFDTLGGDEQ